MIQFYTPWERVIEIENWAKMGWLSNLMDQIFLWHYSHGIDFIFMLVIIIIIIIDSFIIIAHNGLLEYGYITIAPWCYQHLKIFCFCLVVIN